MGKCHMLSSPTSVKCELPYQKTYTFGYCSERLEILKGSTIVLFLHRSTAPTMELYSRKYIYSLESYMFSHNGLLTFTNTMIFQSTVLLLEPSSTLYAHNESCHNTAKCDSVSNSCHLLWKSFQTQGQETMNISKETEFT